MKKLTILSLILAAGLSVHAQGKRIETTTKTETVNVDYKTTYKSGFFENMYLQGSFGGTMLFGEDDSNLSFGDRVKPGFAIAIGKKFTPTFGVRINMEGNRLLGWNDGQGGNYPNHTTDPRKEYLEAAGVNTSNGYDQNIKYYSLGADFMVDLVNAFSKEKRYDRNWEVEAYVGAAAITTIERKGIEDRTQFAARAGISTTYNISKHFGINLDLGGTATSASFDGHTDENDFDGICSAKLGIKWKFGKQGFKKSHVISASQYEALNNMIAVVRTEQMDSNKPEEKVVVIPAPMDKILVPFVVFHDGKDTFNQELQMVNISNIATMLKNNPGYSIDIVGNTKATKADIAENRANKVKKILVDRYSIDAERLTVKVQEMSDSNQTVHFVNK